ncbi:hypothetical protein C8A05DRAFT_36986 [Staphylotrichum tortipilum]|uniref:Extracellular membrane protein CFEM domain-containing protein n=1 Tax=Staphylotrichum tortipilum TaxID=2831512 RepID=A0AAN6MF66_9PEZI|nr:hypothetical protein C8A05DRAFT_36986 [Staphylotrichum longicolle]
MGFPHPLLPLLLLLPTPLLARDPASVQSLAAMPEYTSQPPCATGCFYQREGACSNDLVGATLGCAADCISWASNDCYCRTDYQSLATAYLSSCVSKACTKGENKVDIAAATSLYGAYCRKAGYTPPPEPTATGDETAQSVATVYVTVTAIFSLVYFA